MTLPKRPEANEEMNLNTPIRNGMNWSDRSFVPSRTPKRSFFKWFNDNFDEIVGVTMYGLGTGCGVLFLALLGVAVYALYALVRYLAG